MKIGDYSVSIPEGVETINPDGSEYVSLTHGQHYSIALGNHRCDGRRCLAQIFIDGDLIQGCPIIESMGRFVKLEGIPNSGKKFTFYQSGSEEAIQSGESVLSAGEKGLITVVFYAEEAAPQHPTLIEKGMFGDETAGYEYEKSPRGGRRHTSGVTGLSGKSSQRFSSVQFKRDLSSRTEINLRLIARQAEEGVFPISERREGAAKISNPVAPPISWG